MRVIRVGTRKSQVSTDIARCLPGSNTHKVTQNSKCGENKCVGVSFMGNGSLPPLKRQSLEQGNDRGTENGAPRPGPRHLHVRSLTPFMTFLIHMRV